MCMWEYRQCIFIYILVYKLSNHNFSLGTMLCYLTYYDLDMSYICHIKRRTKQLENLNKIWKGGDKW